MNKKVTRVQKENIYLKTEFISNLQSKDLAPSTIVHYVRELALFLEWIEKEEIQILKTDILNYLDYLKNKRKLENISRSRILLSLNHYFTFLHKAEQISANPCSFLKIRGAKKVSLYRTYTPEELTELYDNYYNTFVRTYDDSHIPKNQRKQSKLSKTRNAVILNILIHQGATTKEIDLLELCDLDLMGASIKLRAGKKSNSRVLPLQATQIGVLMVYLQTIRPELENYQAQESEKLFLPLPETSKSKTDSSTLMHVFKPLTKHLKEIDKNFLSFKQIRASVITNWLKVHGLRKTQFLAGHRYISSTEKYKANDLQQLTDDISKLHPFQ
jgi:integrase/recombinase XerD